MKQNDSRRLLETRMQKSQSYQLSVKYFTNLLSCDCLKKVPLTLAIWLFKPTKQILNLFIWTTCGIDDPDHELAKVLDQLAETGSPSQEFSAGDNIVSFCRDQFDLKPISFLLYLIYFQILTLLSGEGRRGNKNEKYILQSGLVFFPLDSKLIFKEEGKLNNLEKNTESTGENQ